jgi:hypothetical protein
MTVGPRSKRTCRKVIAAVALAWPVLGGLPRAMAQTTTAPPVDESKLADDKKSLTEVNKELTNPIGTAAH